MQTTRDHEAEKAWREQYFKEFNEYPSEADTNIAVYGERMPAFGIKPGERLRFKLNTIVARFPWRSVKRITEYATGLTIGLLAHEWISSLF